MRMMAPTALLVVGIGLIGEDALGQVARITVPASQGCVNTGINVKAQESIQFSAIGTGTYGYEGTPVNAAPITNPDGDRFDSAGKNIGRKTDPHAIFPGPIGALIGKIGISGNPFLIGAGNEFPMPQSGTLFLCYNDVEGQFDNNTGGYDVSIYRR